MKDTLFSSELIDQQLIAGAGKAVMEVPKEFFPQESFSGIHDNIHVRAVILEGNQRIAIISLELTSLPAPEVQLLKELVHSITGIEFDHIWICATHSFSSPHFLPPHMLLDEASNMKNDMLRQAVRQAVHKAVLTALSMKKEASISIGYGNCNVNINRDIKTTSGWWIGSNPEGDSDKTVTVIRIEEKGKEEKKGKADKDDVAAPIAILYHYNVQSSVMDGSLQKDGSKLITSDLVGYASIHLERHYNESTVAMFLLGAAGDQAPVKKAKYNATDENGSQLEIDLGEAGFSMITELGEQLGNAVLNTLADISHLKRVSISTQKKEFVCPGQKLPEDIHSLRPTLTYEYLPEEKRDMEVEAINLGEILLLGTKPELNCKTAKEIQKASPFSHTLIMTMVNGGAKYMADQESYERITYEAMNSPFGKGAAEILIENSNLLIHELKNKDRG